MDAKLNEVRDQAESRGFVTYTFKVGWYNDAVGNAFKLPFEYDALGVLLLSSPDMFELNFLPYLKNNPTQEVHRDPLDSSVADFVSHLKESILKNEAVETYFDYETDARTRRPRILLQTVGHVSGAAFYYQQMHLTNSESSKKLYGVSIHPDYGGWFAFRSVMVFPHHFLPRDLSPKPPVDVVPGNEDRLKLLLLFNDHWKDSRFRDIIQPQKRYSELQQKYFDTPPADRKILVNDYLSGLPP